MKSRSEMRRIAVQKPELLIAEIERLRAELADAQAANYADDFNAEVERRRTLQADNARLREVLTFYRDGEDSRPWVASVMADGGRKARAALEGT